MGVFSDKPKKSTAQISNPTSRSLLSFLQLDEKASPSIERISNVFQYQQMGVFLET